MKRRESDSGFCSWAVPVIPFDWYEEMAWEMERAKYKGPVKIFTKKEIKKYEQELRKEGRL